MKPFYIVGPAGSAFAKTIQQGLKDLGIEALRTQRVTRNAFYVTPQPLNKIEQLTAFKECDVPAPEFALTSDEARRLSAETLFARTTVTGTNGRGIVKFERDSETYPEAPLYTGYIKKKSEFRVHVFDGSIIDVQEKRQRSNFEGVRDVQIRNLSNGYVYCHDNVALPNAAAAVALGAVEACRYEYGAVDIIYNETRDKVYVLEVNSRPGLEGQTLEKYAEAIQEKYLK